MNRILLSTLCILTPIIFSCSKKNVEVHPQLERISIYDASKLKTLKEINNSILNFDIIKSNYIEFSIRGGKFHSNHLYLNNSNFIRLDAYDIELNPKFSIGKRGKGPGELTEILDFAFSNDSLYVSDASFRLISYSLHDPKNHSERVIKEKIIALAYYNGKLLSGQFDMANPIIPLLKSVNDSSVTLGHTYNHEYNILNIFMNDFRILPTKDYLALYFFHSPEIYLFDKDFSLLKIFQIPKLRTQIYEHDLSTGSVAQLMTKEGVDGIVTVSNSISNNLLTTIGHGKMKKGEFIKSFKTIEIDCDLETITKTNLTSNFVHLDSMKDMIFAFDPDTYELVKAERKHP